MKFFLSLIFSMILFSASAQNSVWRPSNISFKIDTTSSLEDTTGSTVVIIPVNHYSSLINFPEGFRFRLGIDSFNNFSVSKYAYLRLGSLITEIGANGQDKIIAPFFCGQQFSSIRYKLTGSAPYRKFLIEWSGINYIPTGQSLRVQLVLHETNGKIQMQYSGVNSFSSSSAFQYQILFRQSFYNVYNMAAVDIKPGGQSHSLSFMAFKQPGGYTGWNLFNYEGIYPLSRFTIQPDTVKPATPTSILFQNIQPGCMDIVPVYDSAKAFVSVLEKRYSEPDFYRLGVLPAGNFYYDSMLLAEANYQFRLWTCNGFVTSDTFQQTHQMPQALINGTIQVPGDYPNITSLLQDAKCKQLGTNVVIELQNNYSFALEPNTVRFTSRYRSPAIQHIVIRPAPGASIVLDLPANKNSFVIDSMAHVEFDGRPGGIGNTASMTFRQAGVFPAIQYIGAADSGEVRYCIFEGELTTAGMVNITDYNPYNPYNDLGCNNIYIHHNKFGRETGKLEKAIACQGGYLGTGTGLRIENNEFYRFSKEAVTIKLMANAIIKENRFYQPDSIHLTGGACLRIQDCGAGSLVEGNKFGGKTAAWGTDKWISSSSSGTFSFIDVVGGCTIKNNQFGNIRNTGTMTNIIHSINGDMNIISNRIGTADSVGSIVTSSNLSAIWLRGEGKKRVDSNLVSGLKCKGALEMASVFSYAPTPDNIITNNDFGGSDNYNQNTSTGLTYGVSIFPGSTIVRNNKIRGISSGSNEIIGIQAGKESFTPGEGEQFIETNEIHHLWGKLSVYGVYLNINSNKTSRVTENKIYALRSTGPVLAGGTFDNVSCGIFLKSYQFTIPFDSMMWVVKNNLIHSFEYLNSGNGGMIYNIKGIEVFSTHKASISNNVIRLGLTTTGADIDTVQAYVTGMVVNGLQVDVSHNSIYLGGTGGTGLRMVGNNSPKKNMYVTNNILMIHKTRARYYDDENIFFETGYPSPVGNINSIASNNNLWFSPNDPNLNNKLAAWRNKCHCDSATIISDPKFIAPSGDSSLLDLHLGLQSAADSAGTPPFSPVIFDKDSLQRNLFSPVDIGAYAATPCSTSSSPEITLNSVSENLYKCPGNSITLSAVINGSYSSLVWQKDFNNISGATGTILTVTDPGSYRLVANYPCGKTASMPVLVQDTVITDISTTITASPSAEVCLNTPVTLTISSSNCTNCIFTWSNGVIGPSITVTSGGSYSVTANSGCGTKTVSKTVTIHPDPIILMAATPSSTICQGGYANLFAYGADNLTWSPTTGLSSFYGPVTAASPASTTTYTVTGTKNGCTGSNNITITVNPKPTISITPVDPGICTGGSVTLNASGAGNYLWSPATGLNTTTGSAVIASPAVTTKYTAKGNTAGCEDSSSVIVSVTTSASPVISISLDGCSTGNIVFNTSLINGGLSPTINWYVDNVLSGNGPTFSPVNAANGMKVHAALISSLQCAQPQAVNSDTININCIVTGLPQLDDSQSITVSPNPTNGLISIKLKLMTAQRVSFYVFDQLGRKIYHSLPIIMNGITSRNIDLGEVASGVYYLQTIINTKSIVTKIIVQRD